MTQKNPAFHWAWVVLAVSFADLFINYSIRLGYGVILPEMIDSLKLSRTAGGSIYNAYLFTYIALTPLTGVLTDRLGARRVISVCSVVLGIGALFMGTSTNLSSACLFYGVAGLGATGMWTPVITVVQRWFDPSKRGLALGIMSTGYGLGFAVTGAAFPLIVRHFDWRHAWYLLGMAALVMGIANGLFLRSDPETSGLAPWGQAASAKRRSSGAATVGVSLRFSDIFRFKAFWRIGLSYFCISYALYGITTFMVDYARSQLGLPLERAGLLATVHGFSQVAGVLILLPLSDRLGRKRTILLSNGCIAVSLTGILVSKDPGLLYAWVGLMALFYGATFPIYGACAGDYFPREVMGSVIGSWTPFYGAGAILSHWVTGGLRDAAGTYETAFALNAAAAALAFLFFWGLDRKNSAGPLFDPDSNHDPVGSGTSKKYREGSGFQGLGDDGG